MNAYVEEKQPIMGLKDAKDIIDAFCLEMLKREADVLATLDKQEIINLLIYGQSPEGMTPYRSTICQKYFGLDCIPAIKQLRENPVELFVKMALHKNS